MKFWGKSGIIVLALLNCLACKEEPKTPIENDTAHEVINETTATIKLTEKQANLLAELPLACIQKEYPNKLGQVLATKEDIQEPHVLHPAFYGCFDWHSAVHGHWSLVALLKSYPNLEQAANIKEQLKKNLSAQNIQAEVVYFNQNQNSSYERTYGWAWLLKLAEELHTWDDPLGKELSKNLKPLTNLIVERYISFLPKLKYPIRVGEHTNTAFGLSFAWDYAYAVGHEELLSLIAERAKDFYLNDQDCPLHWEPSGFDFISPCLAEAELMARILNKAQYKSWFSNFLPKAIDHSFQLEPGQVSDRTDGKLVHLDGVNFSRAWALYTIAKKLEHMPHLEQMAIQHINYSLSNLVGDDYEGGHWLASFAIYALKTGNND